MQFLNLKSKQAPRKGIAGVNAGILTVGVGLMIGFVILYMFGIMSEDASAPAAVQNYTDAVIAIWDSVPSVFKLLLFVILLGAALYVFIRYVGAAGGTGVE